LAQNFYRYEQDFTFGGNGIVCRSEGIGWPNLTRGPQVGHPWPFNLGVNLFRELMASAEAASNR